jgi:catecholate siderophore receptor
MTLHAENLSLTATTASLGPEKDRTYEGGVKATALDGKPALQAGYFQTEMINARVGDPTNPTAPQVLAGKERVRGAEIDASGYVTTGLELTAGYTHLDSVTLKSTNAASVGAPLINTAPNQANLWTVYEIGEIWKLGAGFNWLDRRPADIANTAHVPGYVTFDAMMSYRFDQHFAVQVSGYNLANRYYFTNSYFSSPVENHVAPGAGRTALLTATVNF